MIDHVRCEILGCGQNSPEASEATIRKRMFRSRHKLEKHREFQYTGRSSRERSGPFATETSDSVGIPIQSEATIRKRIFRLSGIPVERGADDLQVKPQTHREIQYYTESEATIFWFVQVSPKALSLKIRLQMVRSSLDSSGRCIRDPGQGKITQPGALMHGLRPLGPTRLGTTSYRWKRLGGAVQAGETVFPDKYPGSAFWGGVCSAPSRGNAHLRDLRKWLTPAHPQALPGGCSRCNSPRRAGRTYCK